MKRNLSPAVSLPLLILLGACDPKPGNVAAAPQQPPSYAVNASPPPQRQHDPAQVARGLAVYERHCAECHGVAGKGQEGDWRVRNPDGYYPPPPLDDSAHAWHHPTAVLLDAVRNGSAPGEGKMPAWKGILSEAEMVDVVEYIKSLWTDPVYALWWKLEQQSLEE